MFILGILVGRGNAPVEFDTHKFQKRLANISGKYEIENKSSGETDIQFYEALQKPMPKADEISSEQNSIDNALDNPAKVENESDTEKKEDKTIEKDIEIEEEVDIID